MLVKWQPIDEFNDRMNRKSNRSRSVHLTKNIIGHNIGTEDLFENHHLHRGNGLNILNRNLLKYIYREATKRRGKGAYICFHSLAFKSASRKTYVVQYLLQNTPIAQS